MKKLRLFLAYLHAGSMDITVGVFLITFLTWIFDIPFAWWHIVLGATLTVLPDFDIFWPLAQNILFSKPLTATHHKTWFHFPLVMLPVVGVVGYVAGGWQWAVIAVIGVLAHYVHDAITIERGGFYWLTRTHRTTWKNIVEETPNAEWVEKNWLQWSRLSVTETMIAFVALVGALYLTLV